MPDDCVNGFGGGNILGVNDQVRVVRGQIVGIDADQGIDLTLDVNDNQVFDGIEDKAPGILTCSQGGNDHVDAGRRRLVGQMHQRGDDPEPIGRLKSQVFSEEVSHLVTVEVH
jgi:hypothetical protein